MTFLSAVEDFVLRTLARLTGRLDRLEYLGKLRNGEEYEHWGMARVYGPTAAKQAIANAHTQASVELLRTPVRELSQELEGSPVERAEGWRDNAHDLMPADLGGGTKTHFNSVLVALYYLLRSKRPPTGRGA